MIVHLPRGNEPSRAVRAGRRPPTRQRHSREAFERIIEDPGYLAFKQQLGEKLTASELARLEAARAPVAQPEGGEP